MEDSFCGVWGSMREKYLREKNPKLYAAMLEKGELEEYLTSYQKSYSQRAEKIFEKLLLKRGINKELYEKDSLEWILETEKIQEEVKEILKEEIQK